MMAGMEQGDCQEKRKRKPTPEQMAVVNAMNKAETADIDCWSTFGKGDYFLTLTYRIEARPPDMAKSKEGFHESDKQAKDKIQERTDRIALDPEH